MLVSPAVFQSGGVIFYRHRYEHNAVLSSYAPFIASLKHVFVAEPDHARVSLVVDAPATRYRRSAFVTECHTK